MKNIIRWFKRLLGLVILFTFIIEFLLCVVTLGLYYPWNENGDPNSKLQNLALDLLNS